MLGPIDYVVVGFKGNNFDGTILEELGKAVDSGAIRLVDLVFIIKDTEGDVAMAEIADQHDELKDVAKMLGHEDDLPLLTEDDVNKLGAKMENDTSAGVLVIEHLWAKGLKKALLDKGAILIDEGRLHPDAVEAAVSDIKESKE
ncbi:DUF1269 domain-containing protein [Candidatus Saccharibacteria bacterium]|nr:DUF1269 domain-containing protein [Candidatus Saccharibacteria bacterium]